MAVKSPPREEANLRLNFLKAAINWAPSSEFVSSSIPSWHISTAHVQPFRGARDLVFCLKVPLDSLLVWTSSEGSGETARMRRLAWTFAARIGDKHQILLTRPNYSCMRIEETLRPTRWTLYTRVVVFKCTVCWPPNISTPFTIFVWGHFEVGCTILRLSDMTLQLLNLRLCFSCKHEISCAMWWQSKISP